MITITVDTIPSPPNAIDQAAVETANAVITDYSKALTRHLGSSSCSVHPNYLSTLRLYTDKNWRIRWDKTGFCCSQFAQAVEEKLR